MEVVDKIAEPEGPWVATAQQLNNLELPASLEMDASREGESAQQPGEKDLSAEGKKSFRGEGGRSSFSGVSHPPEPIDVDLMSTVYAAIDEENPRPPECLLPGLSAEGPSMEDISVHATDVESNVVGLVEEMKVPGTPVPEPSTQSSSEKDCVRGASLPPSGNGSPHSGSDSAGVVVATSIRDSCTSTCRSGSNASEPVVTAGRTHDSAKGSFRGSSMESMSQASDNSDDSGWSSTGGTGSKPHKGNDPRWRAILAVRARGSALGMSHFRLLRRLGCGDIGSVYLSELSGTRRYFAMKVMDKASLASRKKLGRARTEREILQLLDHPFLPTLYTHFETDRFSCLVMEFCPGGDLHALRQRQPGKHFSEYAARFYAAEVLLALEYLHMLGVVYRDLKPENVLVRDDGHIMLSDFDLSLQQCAVSPTLVRAPACDSDPRRAGGAFCVRPSACMEPAAVCVQPACFMPKRYLLGRRSRRRGSEPGQGVSAALPELVAEPTVARSMSFVGTHEYLAPEIIKGEGHGSAVDWWTLGVFLHELLYGRTPFKGSGNRATLFNVVGQQLRFPESPSTSYAARDLVRGLLVKEPQQRLGVKRGAAEIKQHPFFEGVNWALIRCSAPPEVPKPPAEAEPPAKCGATQQPPASSCNKTAIGAEVKSGGKFLDFEFF